MKIIILNKHIPLLGTLVVKGLKYTQAFFKF